VRSELTYMLVKLDKEFTSEPRDFYASEFLPHFGS
jgi:hypothetical protein